MNNRAGIDNIVPVETALYIHIPFCRRKCIYCDFYSIMYDEALARSYADAVVRELDALDRSFTTVYIGGGTPTVLSVTVLEKLLGRLKPHLAEGCEFTVEANPESLDGTKLKALLAGGVNRLSIGVQSFDDRKLKKLGRVHDAASAIRAVELAARSGLGALSMDLIFGVCGEGMDTWRKDIEEAASLPVEHISCYSLTCEKGTPLYEAVRQKSAVLPDDDTAAEMYEYAIERLSVRGFKQYEVSNFARKGYECRHNLNYWENNPYTGIGASAVSYEGGVRASNVADASEYISRITDGRTAAVSSERLTPEARARETAAVKIRTKNGIDLAWFKEKTGYDLLKLERDVLPRLEEDGLLKYRKEGVVITGVELRRRGLLLCDLVSSELL